MRDERAAERDGVARRTLVVLALVALALVVWRLSVVLLLLFGGALLGVLLRGMADRVVAWTPLGRAAALPLVILLILALLGVGGLLFGAQMAAQFGELGERLGEAFGELEQLLADQPWGAWVLAQTAAIEPQDLLRGGMTAQIAGAATVVVEGLVNLLFLLVVGLYLAAGPDSYRRGLVRLVPPSYRPRIEDVLGQVDHALWNWLTGQLVAMLVVGLMSWLGLLLLGVPMALALGVLAGILNFVPVVGPIVASVPAILVGFTQGGWVALYVTLLYIVIQQVESYAIMPLVQRWAVALPPVLALTAIIAFGILFGIWGIIFATPLMVTVMVVVRTLYVEDVLEGRERLEVTAR